MTGQTSLKASIRREMEEARGMTLRLLELVPEEFFKRRIHDFYSPIGWHFGHIGMTEEYWAVCQALKRAPRNIARGKGQNRIELVD